MSGAAPSTLYVVSTPIGNLEDITLRALRVLQAVDLIAAEDTRRTAKLLQHYAISTPTTSLHEHNERQKLPLLTQRLLSGGSVALVSDAGTPTISDPGAKLVRAARDLGIRLEAVPGPSAVTAALSASGLAGDTFLFAGFAPSRSNTRIAWLRRLANEPTTIVFFEAPHRIQRTLVEAGSILGDRPIILARELTKIHEELIEGPISDVARRIQAPRGEYTVILPPVMTEAESTHLTVRAKDLAAEYGQMTNQGLSRRAAIRELAKKYGTNAHEIFAMLEQAKLN